MIRTISTFSSLFFCRRLTVILPVARGLLELFILILSFAQNFVEPRKPLNLKVEVGGNLTSLENCVFILHDFISTRAPIYCLNKTVK